MKHMTLITLTLLTGCATTAPALHTRTADGTAYTISGRYDELREELHIQINGQTISGKLSILDGSGTVQGEHNGQPVTATCARTLRGWTERQECAVTIAGQPAGTLAF